MTARIIVTLLACSFPIVLSAQVYTWKDASGRTHFSDQPPPSVDAKPLRGKLAADTTSADTKSTPDSAASAPPDAKASGPKGWEERERDFRQRQKEKAEADAKAKKSQEEKAEKDRYCSDLRRNLAMLERGGRIGKANDKGETIPMSDNQIQSEIESNRTKLAKDCK